MYTNYIPMNTFILIKLNAIIHITNVIATNLIEDYDLSEWLTC
jgi:hypothetical protein